MEKNGGRRSFLFNVDIMIEADSSGIALEQLLRIMHDAKLIKDYQINSGITLGQLIKQALAQTESTEAIPELKKQVKTVDVQKSSEQASATAKGKSAAPPQEQQSKAPAKAQLSEAKSEPIDMIKRIQEFIAGNTLIRLTILKGKAVKLSLPCRIIAYDSVLQTVTVYHVDEKQVYQFRSNEIDDFTLT